MSPEENDLLAEAGKLIVQEVIITLEIITLWGMFFHIPILWDQTKPS
jgi:hypothetical protein